MQRSRAAEIKHLRGVIAAGKQNGRGLVRDLLELAKLLQASGQRADAVEAVCEAIAAAEQYGEITLGLMASGQLAVLDADDAATRAARRRIAAQFDAQYGSDSIVARVIRRRPVPEARALPTNVVDLLPYIARRRADTPTGIRRAPRPPTHSHPHNDEDTDAATARVLSFRKR